MKCPRILPRITRPEHHAVSGSSLKRRIVDPKTKNFNDLVCLERLVGKQFIGQRRDRRPALMAPNPIGELYDQTFQKSRRRLRGFKQRLGKRPRPAANRLATVHNSPGESARCDTTISATGPARIVRISRCSCQSQSGSTFPQLNPAVAKTFRQPVVGFSAQLQ